MITTATKDALKEIAPPVLISSATLFGVRLEDWVLYLTLAYAAVRLILLIPNVIGCTRCFIAHKTCTLVCKNPPSE